MIQVKGTSFSGAADNTSDVFADVADNTILLQTGDGAITLLNGTIIITKNGNAALSIGNPTSTTDDGKRLKIMTSAAHAHVITNATSGFNNKGSSGTLTWASAAGNSCTLLAYQGKWYCTSKNGVTVA